MSQSPGPGWWLASDGKWYPPHLHPDARRPAPAQVERRPAEPQLSPRTDIPAPLGDPNAPLPRRQPSGAGAPAPTSPPGADQPIAPSPGPPPATDPAPQPVAPPAAGDPPPAAPEPAVPATPSPAAAGADPVVRWNSEQQRQPVESGPAGRGLSAPTGDADDDPSRLIPLPDLDTEPPPEAPRVTNKAPTLADTLLGARATTPEAALPTDDRSLEPSTPSAHSSAPATEAPQAERWERPTHGAPAAIAHGLDTETETPSTEDATPAVEDDTDEPPAATTQVADQRDIETEIIPDERPGRRGDRLVNVGVLALAVVLAAGAAFFLLRDDGSGDDDGDGDGDGASNMRAVSALAVGDCFGGELLGEAEVEQVPIVECSMPHQYQVFHSTEFEPADSSFAPEAIRRSATAACSAELEAILGVPLAESSVQLLLLNPTEASWNDEQDRTSLCLAYDPEAPLRAPIGS